MAATTNARAARPAGDDATGEAVLLALVQATLRELHADAPGLPAVTLQSVLDRDLGLDSLTRMELLLRTEREFGVALPEDALQRTETIADLLDAVSRARASARPGERIPAPRHRTEPLAPVPSDPPAPLGAALAGEAAPTGANTLIEVLDWHVQHHPDQTQVICLDGDTEHLITYGGLASAAAAIAAGLQRAGVRPRQCVAIMLPTSPAYFSTYFGILLAGAIPVPIYPPARASQLEDHVLRHTGILANAQACALVTVEEAMVVARLLQARVPGLRHVLTAEQLALPGAAPAPVALYADDIAFIQYTSGSTGNPKGVALTHANLLANIRAMAKAAQAMPRDTALGYTLSRPSEDRYVVRRSELDANIAVLLGGRAAEQMMFGELSTGAADDIARATTIARDMVTRYGMDESLGHVSYSDGPPRLLDVSGATALGASTSPQTAERIDAAVQRIVQAGFERASQILERNRAVLNRAARALLAKETLDEAELAGLAAGLLPWRPDADGAGRTELAARPTRASETV